VVWARKRVGHRGRVCGWVGLLDSITLVDGVDGVPCPGMSSGKRLAVWMAAALILAGCAAEKPRPTMPNPNAWYQVHDDTAGKWETAGPKGSDECHWLRASKPSGDMEDWIDVGQWDLHKTSGGTMKIPINSGEWLIYWGCYPFHFVG
jgi:hypothetical protein